MQVCAWEVVKPMRKRMRRCIVSFSQHRARIIPRAGWRGKGGADASLGYVADLMVDPTLWQCLLQPLDAGLSDLGSLETENYGQLRRSSIGGSSNDCGVKPRWIHAVESPPSRAGGMHFSSL